MTTTQTQIRRDTATNLLAATPAEGELGYDKTNKRLVVGDGTAAGGLPHASAKDVQTQSFVYPTVGGTGNAITLANTVPALAYAAPLKQVFKAAAGNTTAVTANVDTLGLKNVKKMNNGALADLVSGDIVAGGIYEMVYDGTQFQIKGLAEGPFSGGAMKFLGSVTASGSASVDLTSLLSSTYDDYDILLDNVVPSTSATLGMYASGNNSTFDSGSNYSYALNGTVTSATNVLRVSGTLNTSDGVSGRISLRGVNNSAAVKLMDGSLSSYSGGLASWQWGGAWTNTPNLLEAVRFAMSTGSIASGTFRVYGITKS